MNLSIEKAYQIIYSKIENWIENLIDILPNLTVAFLILLVFYILGRLIRKGSYALIGRISDSESLKKLFSSIIFSLIVALGLFIALGVLQLDKALTSLLAGAGILGLALGFAFQDIAANFMSGVIMAIKRPIKVGDVVTTGSFTGTVLSIDLRNTILLTFDGQHVLIPNKEVFQNPIVNFSVNGRRRIDFTIGVSYADDLEKVRVVAIEAISALGYADEIACNFVNFNNSSIDFFLTFFIPFPSEEIGFLQAKNDAVIAIKKAFDREGITIPFPITTLDFGIKGGVTLSEMNRKN
ncbi:mechanosensitive ion channel family protein [Cytophagales bacterium LB-30]|uniref:Mechanosensitive ion channel family protein n=1 Tax=Shiella aurantiaca TaxID=3058365 RepID=A0ABT8F1R4_9BACT|nr:mechanosensitive ion channel family protein [Shiella aurantiaca]MDN4164299.1 mechanosensitive ion channel family protein [Shiella aurantiaca]